MLHGFLKIRSTLDFDSAVAISGLKNVLALGRAVVEFGCAKTTN